MAALSTLQDTNLPARAQAVVEGQIFLPDEAIKEDLARFRHVQSRAADKDGDTEVIEGAKFTHHFILGPGDGEVVQWHYVEAGPQDGEVIVFLHGIPDAWLRAVDEGAGEQLFQMLQLIGAKRFNVVTHDRGTCQADFIAANHPDHVLRYARGEQHLYHFNPVLAPQGEIFMSAAYNGARDDAARIVLWAHLSLDVKMISDEKLERCIQEFSYPDIRKAVPRYFNSSSFRAEWLQRRERLLGAWTCPVLILQGFHSKTQPREFYQGITQEHIPNAKSVEVKFLDGGHFWPLECADETTAALEWFFRC